MQLKPRIWVYFSWPRRRRSWERAEKPPNYKPQRQPIARLEPDRERASFDDRCRMKRDPAEEYMPVAEFQQEISKLKDLVKIQTASASDAYMRGMANGLICAVACLEKKDPQYLDSPKDYPAPALTETQRSALGFSSPGDPVSHSELEPT